MLNLVVPLLTLFGVLNLVVSSEAIEGFFNFFQDTRPGTSRNYVGSDGIIMHGNAATPKEDEIDPSKLQPVVQELYNAQNQLNGNQNFNQPPNSYQQELQGWARQPVYKTTGSETGFLAQNLDRLLDRDF